MAGRKRGQIVAKARTEVVEKFWSQFWGEREDWSGRCCWSREEVWMCSHICLLRGELG